jgi:hypothetical protein
MLFPRRSPAVLKTDSHIPCRSPAATLPFSESALFHTGHSIWDLYASDNNFLELEVASRKHAVNMPSPCRRDPAMALRGRFQKGIFVARQGSGMACVNQTRPHYVNQMGNTQSKALVERHGNGMVCVNPPLGIQMSKSLDLRPPSTGV